MAVAILIIGALLMITVVKGNTGQVAAQVEQDLLGSNGQTSFLLWIGAIIFLAVVGAVLHIPRASKLFIALVIAVFVLKQNGLWSNALSAFSQVQAPAPAPTAVTGRAVNALDQPQGGSTTASASTPVPNPGSLPGTPGISLNPFAGLPTSIQQFLGVGK